MKIADQHEKEENASRRKDKIKSLGKLVNGVKAFKKINPVILNNNSMQKRCNNVELGDGSPIQEEESSES